MKIKIVKPSREEVKIYLKLIIVFFIFISIGIVTAEYQLNKLTLEPNVAALNIKQDLFGSRIYILGNCIDFNKICKANLEPIKVEATKKELLAWYNNFLNKEILKATDNIKIIYASMHQIGLNYALIAKDKLNKISDNIKPYIISGKETTDKYINRAKKEMYGLYEKR